MSGGNTNTYKRSGFTDHSQQIVATSKLDSLLDRCASLIVLVEFRGAGHGDGQRDRWP